MRITFKKECQLLLVLTLLFIIIPFIAVFIQGISFLFQGFFTEEIYQALFLSLKTSTLASIFVMVITVPCTYALMNMTGFARKIMTYILTLPMATPHIISGIALLIIFGGKGIGPFLQEWLGIDFVYTPEGIVLALVFVNLPFSIITLLGSYKLVDERLLFTSRTLGLGEGKSFWYVAISMLRRALWALWIMTWARCIGEFGAILVLVGITRMKTETLATSIFLNLATGDFDVAAGVSTLLLLISIGVTLLCQALMKDNV